VCAIGGVERGVCVYRYNFLSLRVVMVL